MDRLPYRHAEPPWGGRRIAPVWLVTALAAALVLGCPTEDDDDDDSSPAEPSIDLDADSDRSGEIEADGDEDALDDVLPGAAVRPNVDDDNLSGEVDAVSVGHEGADENDTALLTLWPEVWETLEDGEEVWLAIEGDVDRFRFYIDGEPRFGLGGSSVVEETRLDDPGGAPIDIEIEALDFHAAIMVRAQVRDAGGEVLLQDKVVFTSAPFTMQNHLDPAQRLWVVNVTFYGGNVLMRQGIKDAIGEENVVEVSGGSYGQDVWIQDELEFGYVQTPYGPMQMVLDSIRDRGLDDFPENELLTADFGWLERGSGIANSQDSFGNLECTPPITVDGAEYPFGRIYYGGLDNGTHINGDLQDFLEFQEIQAPLMIDSNWLAVGHVDEFMSTVPDSTSDKGFKILWSDYQVALDILEGLDPDFALPRFADDHGYATVGEILEDAIIDYNIDITAERQDPVMEALKDEFGLEESDFIRIPSLVEEVGGVGYNALAMIPGMANLVVYDDTLLIADPFFRTHDEDVDGDGILDAGEDINGNYKLDTDEDANGNGVLDDGEDLNDNGVLDTEEDADGDYQLDPGEDLNGDGLLNTYRDPMIEWMQANLPAELTQVYLDDWNVYHMGMGEVHCGTNVLREPRSDVMWWEVE